MHPTDDYDVLIKLRCDALRRQHQSITANEDDDASKGKYVNLATGVDDGGPLVDYDPALIFFRDLQVSRYANRAGLSLLMCLYSTINFHLIIFCACRFCLRIAHASTRLRIH